MRRRGFTRARVPFGDARPGLHRGGCACARARDGTAQTPGDFYDGSVPFECVLQQAGTEAEFPDPDADPFCVEYDKRHQNVTQLGVVEFLSLEPARVAAATPKCFYYQRDHWVGFVVQEDGRTETYSWDGSYYFDKAKGAAAPTSRTSRSTTRAATRRRCRASRRSGSRTSATDAAASTRPGSATSTLHASRRPRRARPTGASRSPNPSRAAAPRRRAASAARSAVCGSARVREATIEANGEPKRRKAGFFRYCVIGGGKYMVGFGRERAQFLLTSNPGFDVDGVRRLTPKRQARRRLDGERELFRTSKTIVWAAEKDDHTLLVLIRDRSVAALASAAPGLSLKRLKAYYKASK